VTKLFQRLFASRKAIPEESMDIPTVPVPVMETTAPDKPPAVEKIRFDVPQLIVGCAQSIGKQRDHNEDALFIFTANMTINDSYFPFGLYIVADGMGGHQYGEIASGLAIRTVSAQVIQKAFLPFLTPQPAPLSESVQEIMRVSVQEAHQIIVKDAPESGTTLTAVLILGDQITIAHVGDSRVYRIDSDGTAEVLTRDHSLVMRMMELGQLTAEEAAVHPQRNVLYRALGQGEPFLPDIYTLPVPQQGFLLLCSDGLWGPVPQGEISSLVVSAPSPEVACQRLIEAANQAGGPDNITAILVRFPD
jgi:protein phosphatase